ncbi:MAG: RimK family alpha-L-glutamate ligase [Clostridia bacterium]|nr:RimK family alpha-L-glutamate ligase [Clostridia bacterium]
MRGWLIVNPFLDTLKFQEIYGMLCASAEAENMQLEMKTAAELMCPSGDDFKGFVLPDFCIFWDKDVYLAKRLEAAGLRLFNSADAVAKCDNKILTAMALDAAKVPTPVTFISPKTFEAMGYSRLQFFDAAEKALGYPMVLKEAYGSFGQQVYLAHDREEAEKIIAAMGYKDFIMQKFIASSSGRDIRVNVVGGKAVASMLRYNENDFRSNISNGGRMKPCTLTPAQEEAALSACRALGLDFAGVDVMFGEQDAPIICEVNSNPHFKSTLQATGVDLSRHIMQHIRQVITCGD